MQKLNNIDNVKYLNFEYIDFFIYLLFNKIYY